VTDCPQSVRGALFACCASIARKTGWTPVLAAVIAAGARTRSVCLGDDRWTRGGRPGRQRSADIRERGDLFGWLTLTVWSAADSRRGRAVALGGSRSAGQPSANALWRAEVADLQARSLNWRQPPGRLDCAGEGHRPGLDGGQGAQGLAKGHRTFM